MVEEMLLKKIERITIIMIIKTSLKRRNLKKVEC
jgi:hypothetical protein